MGSRARPKFNSRFPEEEHKKVHVHNLSLQDNLFWKKDVITKYMQIKYFYHVMGWMNKKLYILKFQKLRVLQEGIYRYPDKIIYLSSFELFSTLMLNVGHANEAGEESWIGYEVSKIYVIETLPTLSSAPQAFNTFRNHKPTFVAPEQCSAMK